jgi:hypothetical protein
MKNLKKAFAVVVALAMVMSTVAFAAVFSDVDDSAAYAEAIEAGVALKMFTGYEDGTFKPEGDITRAEFAAIVVRMLGQEAQADGAKGVTLFDDVPSTHWAAGYINIVSNLCIVNGYGDGNFGPEDNVTYEQAVKMCVVALGYEPAAGGNYPVGYLTIAQQRGITTGVRGTSGAPINRGQVAQMAFNALDVPLMTQTGFGTYIEYVINDGTNNTDRKTLLSENLGIVKVKGIVTESYELSSVKKADLVELEIINNYKTPYEDEFEEDTAIDVNAGDTNIRSLVGYPVIAYLAYDEMSNDYPVAMYARKDFTSTEELTLAISDIEEIKDVTSGGSVSYYQISYYPSSDARTTEKFTVRAEPNIYVNGAKEETRDILTVLDPADYYGTATFALGDSTNTGEDYDTIYILSYRNAVVESVDTKAGRVDMKEGDPISFGSNKTNVSSTLYDEDGNEIDWSTLQENDILSIRTAKGTVTVNICTLVRNTVEGSITEKSSETDPYLVEFKIGGEKYKVDNQLVIPEELDLNYEGVFYLDIFGRIAHYEAQSSLTRNYAYVIDTGIHDAGFEDRLQIKAFTFDGEVVTFTCATNVTVIKGKAKPEYYNKKDDMGALKDLIAVDSVITFSVNQQGEINRLALPVTSSDIGLNYFAQYADGNDFDYRGSSATIRVGGRSVEISEDTIIMIAGPGFNDDDYDLMSLSVLGDEDIEQLGATTQVYDVNNNMIAGLVVVGESISVAGESAGLAMVSRISQIRDEDGDIINSLTIYQGGEVKDVQAEEENTPDPFWIISPKLNAKGKMSGDTAVIASIQGGRIVTGDGFDNTGDVEYVIGEVTARRGSRLTITGVDGDGNDVEEEIYSIPTSANVYLYNDSATSNARKAMIVDSVSIFSVRDSEYYDEDDYEIESVSALIRWYEGRIQDVVLFFDIDFDTDIEE